MVGGGSQYFDVSQRYCMYTILRPRHNVLGFFIILTTVEPSRNKGNLMANRLIGS